MNEADKQAWKRNTFLKVGKALKIPRTCSPQRLNCLLTPEMFHST